MSIQYSVTVRNSRLSALSTALSTDFTTKFFTGAQPVNCAAADSGTELVSFTACNFAAAGSGQMALTGTPETATAGNTGTVAHFRMYNGSTCHAQGSVTATGGGGDITVDNTSIASGQTVNLSSFTLTAGGA
jgi:hypothetical protein